MKKTLKVIASTAIAMSAFASVAMADDAASTTSTSTDTSATTAPATKTSADFTDLANVDAGLKAKIDALLKAGVFEGTSATTFGINENMTRAQFAKVLDLIYGVNVDMTVKTSSFSDVTADDQANGWAIPYIEAAKKAGLIDGVTDTTFTPGDNVTLGQFATALVKGLGVKPDMTGTPWYADAVKQAITKNVLPADTDGSKVATRADLVVGAYGGQQAYATMNQPAQVSVVSAKATGVQTVTVTFDRDVDTSKATLSLKKGTLAVNTTVKFADDKKSATLTLTDTKLSAGDYTVTLGGLDASAIKTATGTFTAQDETVQKLEFVTASDTIARSTNATVMVKATNQYGENASFTGGSYSVILGNGQNAQITRTDAGLLKLTFDSTLASAGVASQSNLTVIPVNIYFNDTHISVSKNFTVGVAPFITKMDLGNVTYSNGTTTMAAQGEYATFPLNVYDQYGNQMGFKAIHDAIYSAGNTDTGDLVADSKAQVVFSPYESLLSAGLKDYDNNDTPEVRVSLSNNIEKSGDYTTTVYLQGASASTKISVASKAVAEKVTIGDLGGVIAAGDTDVYIPIVAYDADGNQLSTDDLTSDLNVGRINVSVSGATVLNSDGTTGTVAKIWNSGDHKGSIRLSNITAGHNGIVTVTAYIATANANSTDTKSYTVGNARIPDHLKIATVPASKVAPGGYTSFVVQAIDQYGASQDKYYLTDGQGNVLTDSKYSPTSVSGAVYYYTKLTPIGTDGVTKAITTDSDSNVYPNTLTPYTTDVKVGKNFAYGGISGAVQNTFFNEFNNTYRLAASDKASGTFGFKAELIKVNADGTETPIDTQSANVTVATTTESLTYNVNSVANLSNVLDSGLVTLTEATPGNSSAVTNMTYGVYGSAANGAPAGQVNGLTLYTDAKVSREVTVSGKDAAGNSVSLPHNIQSITTSNPTVAKVYLDSTNHRAYVLGNKAGTATISVTFRAADNTIKSANADVTVKSDVVSVDHLVAGNTGVETLGDSVVNSTYAGVNAYQLMDLQAYDNYGVEYEKDAALHYNNLLGVSFSATNIQPVTATDSKGNTLPVGSISFDQSGNITIKDASGNVVTTAAAANIKSFDLNAYAPNGKSVTTPIVLP